MDKLAEAFRRFDEINDKDPHLERDGEREVPKELLYAERMSARLDAYAPDASEAVKLAARAQHINRWAISRSEFPMDRKGYLQWRHALYGHHAKVACDVLREVGYEEALIERVDKLLRKKGLKSDDEVQLLEDVICLVFLEHYWADFAPKHDEPKLLGIVQKTWAKMSERGHAAALALPLRDKDVALIKKALELE